jgi:hypothetical protein
MPQIQSQIKEQGGETKTILKNLPEIAKTLRFPAPCTLCIIYFLHLVLLNSIAESLQTKGFYRQE